LVRPDADLSLHILVPNSVKYAGPVHDPLFFANGSLKEEGYILPNYIASMLGCVEQRRICNPTTQICSEYSGALMPQNATKNLGLNIDQEATAQRLTRDAPSIAISPLFLESSGNLQHSQTKASLLKNL
jgi:hypothetical protein